MLNGTAPPNRHMCRPTFNGFRFVGTNAAQFGPTSVNLMHTPTACLGDPEPTRRSKPLRPEALLWSIILKQQGEAMDVLLWHNT